jgi:hypothetical protein
VNDAKVIRKLEPYMPLQIEVQCHRGHFVANMTLSIRDGQLTIRREHSGMSGAAGLPRVGFSLPMFT